MKSLIYEHSGPIVLDASDGRQQWQLLRLHHVRRADGTTAVDSQLTVNQHATATAQSVVDEALGCSVVDEDGIILVVVSLERHIRDVAGVFVRTGQPHPAFAGRLGGAVEDVRDAQASQQLDVMRIELVSDVDSIAHFRRTS